MSPSHRNSQRQYFRWETCTGDAPNEKMWSASNWFKLVFDRSPKTEFGAKYRAESRSTPLRLQPRAQAKNAYTRRSWKAQRLPPRPEQAPNVKLDWVSGLHKGRQVHLEPLEIVGLRSDRQ